MADVVGSAYGTSPGSVILSKLKNKVGRYVKMPDDPEGLEVAEEHILGAIAKINTREWNFLLDFQDLATTTSADYDIRNDFNKPRHLHALNSNGDPRHRLDFMDPKTFDLEYPDVTGSGEPQAYTVYSKLDTGQLTLEKIPSSNYVTDYPTLRLRYYKYLQYPTGDTTLAVPSEIEHFIEWYAKAGMAAEFDASKVSYAERQWRTVWRQIIVQDNEFTDWN